MQNKELEEKLSKLGWQPIESAPRDGRMLLLYGLANRDNGEAGFESSSNFTVEGQWEEGIWTFHFGTIEPTHWMPISSPTHDTTKLLADMVIELVGALENLARLGNGDEYGNSEGNIIAKQALQSVTDKVRGL